MRSDDLEAKVREALDNRPGDKPLEFYVARALTAMDAEMSPVRRRWWLQQGPTDNARRNRALAALRKT
jgi:hypothetical protein